MHCQGFQAFGLCLSQLLASVQYLLHSSEFAAVLLWMLRPWGHPHPAVYLISACVVPPCACVVFAVLQHGILVLEDSGSWCFPSSTLIAGFLLRGLFQQAASLALDRPVGVLAPWGVTVVAAPGPLGHLASICDEGVNLILSYLFGIFRQAGLVWLLKAGVNVGLYK